MTSTSARSTQSIGFAKVVGGVEGTKLAVTARSTVIETVQVTAVPLHAPPQPPNDEPLAAVAVSVTLVPDANEPLQVDPHSTPDPATAPLPAPTLVTVSAWLPPPLLLDAPPLVPLLLLLALPLLLLPPVELPLLLEAPLELLDGPLELLEPPLLDLPPVLLPPLLELWPVPPASPSAPAWRHPASDRPTAAIIPARRSFMFPSMWIPGPRPPPERSSARESPGCGQGHDPFATCLTRQRIAGYVNSDAAPLREHLRSSGSAPGARRSS
jgi:hypothetical protein